jgi:hypothetical protein
MARNNIFKPLWMIRNNRRIRAQQVCLVAATIWSNVHKEESNNTATEETSHNAQHTALIAAVKVIVIMVGGHSISQFKVSVKFCILNTDWREPRKTLNFKLVDHEDEENLLSFSKENN